MFEMQPWQWITCLAIAIVAVGVMSAAIIRLFTRRASTRATLRRASPVESGLFVRAVPGEVQVFDAWAFRMGARFAGRTRLTIYEDRVAVAGPRVPRRLYQVWVWAQGVLLALVIPLLVAAIVNLDWSWLIVAVVTFVVSFAVSMGGAGLWPGLGELFEEEGCFMAVEFPRSSIREVNIGKGWSKGGFEVVMFTYKAGIDKMSEGLAVSFFAPDEHGHEVRFALAAYTTEKARELAEMLRGDSTG